jgi:two-component system heavy metal sensor histidine kinase CusS
MRWPPTDRTWWASLRVRLTLWNTAVVLVTTLATLAVVQVTARAMLYREAEASLRAAVEGISAAIRDHHPDMAAVVGDMQRMTASHRERGWFMHLLTHEGTTVWRSDNCPDIVVNKPPSSLDSEEVVSAVGPYRYVRQWVRQPGRLRYYLRVGMHTGVLDESVAGLMRLLLPLAIAVSLLTPLIGYLLAVHATRPVAAMLRTAAFLRPTRLAERLPVRGTGDELDRLAGTINGLLDEVARHVERQERFVADAAHELRGPLAAVRSSLEVAVVGGIETEEMRDVLADTLEATRHLSKVANDLLLLAESAGEAHRDAAAVSDLSAVARQTTAMFSGVAAEHGLTVIVDAAASIVVRGDASWLRRVIGNLLDNAIRFTPDGGRVMVHTSRAAGYGQLVVRDTGVGLAPAELARVFERFSKSDRAHSHAAGHRSGGLGLPICRSLVEMLGGTIDITSDVGRGTAVMVSLPAATAPATRPEPAREPLRPGSDAQACPPVALG